MGRPLPRWRRRPTGARAGGAWRPVGGAAGLPAGAGRAVPERAPRPRRADRPRVDALAAPAVLRVLRSHLVGAGDPRGAAGGCPEPGCAQLALGAGVDRARAARPRLGAAVIGPA